MKVNLWFRSLFERGLRLLYPPRCCACKELLSPGETDLCAGCRAEYAFARLQTCPLCVQPLTECACTGPFLDRHGIRCMTKLFQYRPQEANIAPNKLIYRLKESGADAVINFLAREMGKVIAPRLDAGHDYVLVGVPRSKSAIRKYGFDHIRLLCRALSRELKIPYVAAVKRVGREGPQKRKTRKERMRAAAVSFAPTHASLKGKRVILIDDVVTSGATLAACAAAVRKTGARGVICAVTGSGLKYRELLGERKFMWERQKYIRRALARRRK